MITTEYPMRPTEENYTELQQAYDYFNGCLFNGILPDCLLTLQREKRTYGYVSYNRFTNAKGQKVHEMALNPSYFAVIPMQEIMQTMVHEMCHIWQYHYGNPGRGRYHNREWACFMESIGLMPSHTGKPGGKRTGDQMMDYVIEGGLFDRMYEELIKSEFHISWIDRFPEQSKFFQVAQEVTTDETIRNIQENIKNLDIVEPKQTNQINKSNRIKYSCPKCEINVWGKPDLRIKCISCDKELEE